MVVGGKEVNKEQPRPVAHIGPQHRELVRGCRAVNTGSRCTGRRRGGLDVNPVRGDGYGSGEAWRSRCAIQIGRHGGLVELLETRKMYAVAAVVADVNQPCICKLALHVETPLLGVRRLVIDRHPSLNGEWRRGIDSRGRAGRIRQSAPVDTQVGQESLAQADVQLGVAEFQTVVKEHTVASADRSASVSERIPCNADAWSNGAVELLPDLAAERRLGAGKSVEGRRISKNQSVQWVVAGIASAAVRNAVDQLYVHGARRSNAWHLGRVIKRCVK